MFEVIGFIATVYVLIGVATLLYVAVKDEKFSSAFVHDLKEVVSDSPFQAFIYVFCTFLIWPLLLYELKED